jgi:hypothetical protein
LAVILEEDESSKETDEKEDNIKKSNFINKLFIILNF